MDLKVVSVVVFLCALAITSTNAKIPSCCISSTKNVTKKLLLKVERWEPQYGDGVCDINALLLYVKGRQKPICADFLYYNILRKMRRLQRPQRT